MGEDVGTLDGLVAEAEDVVDDEDGAGGVGGAGGVCGGEVGLEVVGLFEECTRGQWMVGDEQHFMPPLRSIYLPLGL